MIINFKFKQYLPVAILLLSLSSFAQNTILTDDGIVDLLNESAKKEDNQYQPQLEVFRLMGENRDRGPQGQLLRLGLHGPIVVVEDNNPTRADLIKKYVRNKEWRKALAETNDGLALNPNNPQLLRLAAFINTVLGDFYMANYYYQRYMEYDPKNFNVLTNWAGVMLRTYKFDEADKLLDRALDINPNLVPAKFYKSIIDVASADSSPSSAEWMRVSLLYKRDITMWITRDIDDYKNILGPTGFDRMCDMVIGKNSGDSLKELLEEFKKYYSLPADEYDQRLQSLTRLSELGVEGLAVPMETASVMFLSGDTDGALNLASKINMQYPNDAVLLTQYGYMLLQQGQYTRAESILRQSLKIGDNFESKLFLASALIMLKQMDEVWGIIWNLVKTNPEKVRSWLQGDQPYIMRLMSENKYPALCNRLGIPPESR